MKSEMLAHFTALLYALFIIQCAASDSRTALNSTNAIVEKFTKKCLHLQNYDFLNPSEFLLECEDFEPTRNTTISKENIPALHCNIIYDTYMALCNASASSSIDLTQILSLDHRGSTEGIVKNTSEDICPILIHFYQGFNNSALSNFSQKYCADICLDFDKTVLKVCRQAALLVKVNTMISEYTRQVEPVPPAITAVNVESGSGTISIITSKDVDPIKHNDADLKKPLEEQTIVKYSANKNISKMSNESKHEGTGGEPKRVNIEKNEIPLPAVDKSAGSLANSDISNAKVVTQQTLPPSKLSTVAPEKSYIENKGETLENSDYSDTTITETRKPNEKPVVTHDEDEIVDITMSNDELSKDDSYFFSYFMLFCILFVIGYVGYHNKQKVLALVLEGRRGRRPQRRRPNSANYHKLDANLEEAVSSACDKTTTNVIY